MQHLADIRLRDPFFAPRIETVHAATIPACLRQCKETGRLDAFRLDWKPGAPNPPHRFWDSDVAKVLEGMAYDLELHPSEEGRRRLDELTALVASAQQPDGYLNTHFTTVANGQRWTNVLVGHELYCCGHLIEAAVAHFQATGSTSFLNCLRRYADHVAAVFGPAPGQIRGYPGHEEIELALCKLADATGDAKYLNLARFFINERGASPNFFEEEARLHDRPMPQKLAGFQAEKPVRDQEEPHGHAVRAMYLYAGMADVAMRTHDQGLLDACRRLWDSLLATRIYATGGIGTSHIGEAIEEAYHLPLDVTYCESCASIGFVLFADRMRQATGDAKYVDALERALYNGALSGISLDGTRFFYVNPQRVDEHPPEARGKYIRKPWFSTSCCPTNFCRFLPQLARFAFRVDAPANTLCIDLPAAADGTARLDNGDLAFAVESRYPYDSRITITVWKAPARPATIAIRKPGWCHDFRCSLPGEEQNGYHRITRQWHTGEIISLDLPMPVETLHAHPMVENCAGCFLLCRGPLVYCLESHDNGPFLSRILIPEEQEFQVTTDCGLLGAPAITGRCLREELPRSHALYSTERPARVPATFTAIPYALWQNRGDDGSMRLWIRSI